jgi:hypothetical protein
MKATTFERDEEPKKLVSAAAFPPLGVPRNTLYLMARKGLIPTYRVGPKGRGLRFVIGEVLTALRTREKS